MTTLSPNCNRPEPSCPSLVDFIIVGGGTAGCVLAGSLIEQQSGSVAVIEAGSYPRGRRIRTPAYYPQLFGSRWDESRRTSPQPGLRGRSIAWPRGRMLGGCSSMNAMIYSRGHPADFQSWPSAWHYPQIAPYFEAVERKYFAAEEAEPARRQRQDRAAGYPPLHPLSEAFLQAAAEAGWTYLGEDSYIASLGAGPFRRTQCRGRRLSSFEVFLKPWLNSESLTLLTDTRVERIDIADQRAMGVTVVRQGARERWRARRGIILCGGTLESPALLIQSGIGPKEIVTKAGGALVVEREEVGNNLQDHLIFPIIYRVAEGRSLPPIHARESRVEYLRSRGGPLASNLAEVGGFGRLDTAANPNPEAVRPDYQIHFTPTHYLEYPLREQPASACTLGVTLLHPQSRGRLVPSGPPPSPWIIDPAYLSEPADLDQTVQGVRLAAQLVERHSLAGIVGESLIPAAGRWDDARLKANLRAYSTTLYHPLGTCRMGVDGSSVVDSSLRVRGLDGLFVCDASVIPELPSANPQGTVMMLAYCLAHQLSSHASIR